jgi:hypothetical protein
MAVNVATKRKSCCPSCESNTIFFFLLNAAYALAVLDLISHIPHVYLTWGVARWIRTDITVGYLCMKIFIFERVGSQQLEWNWKVQCWVTLSSPKWGSVCACVKVMNMSFMHSFLKEEARSLFCFHIVLFVAFTESLLFHFMSFCLLISLHFSLFLSVQTMIVFSFFFTINLYLSLCCDVFTSSFICLYMDLTTVTTVSY